MERADMAESTRSHRGLAHLAKPADRLGEYEPSPETRLGERVVVMGECWVVDGNPDRYSTLEIGGKRMSAHRWIYMTMVGVVDDDEHVHHTCLHPGCIRPDHLMALSASDHATIHADLRRTAH